MVGQPDVAVPALPDRIAVNGQRLFRPNVRADVVRVSRVNEADAQTKRSADDPVGGFRARRDPEGVGA